MSKKASVPPGNPPTMSPERAVPLIEQLIQQADEIRDAHRSSPQVTKWRQTATMLLAAAFGNNSENVRAFEVAKESKYFYLPGAPDSEYQKMHVEAVEDSAAVLRSAVEQLRWLLPDPTQVFLPAGSPHDAYVEIRKIVQTVSSEVLIVDSYVDGTLWSLLKNVAPTVTIRIMTMQMKGDFGLEAIPQTTSCRRLRAANRKCPAFAGSGQLRPLPPTRLISPSHSDVA